MNMKHLGFFSTPCVTICISLCSTDQGLKRGVAQSKSQAAAGGGAGVWQLHEQRTERQRIWLQNLFAQQDCRHQVQH